MVIVHTFIKKSAYLVTIAALVVSLFAISSPAKALVRNIIFPVVGPARFSNDYFAPRSNGIHGATDIIANKGQQLVAAVDGTITFVAYPQPSYGYMVSIRDAEGFRYNYIHINNDTPGTDDGNGGGMHAYAPDVKRNNPVVRGQLLGWVGDSGNAEGTVPHLHFEIIAPDGGIANPYDSLLQAQRIPGPPLYPPLPGELLPYGPGVGSAVNVATGKFDVDSANELITGAGRGGGPHVRVFDDNNNILREFMAYSPQFMGGVDVAAGDVDGDGIDEFITAPEAGGGPHVRVFKIDGTEVGGFMAYSPQFSGGIRVATADVDGDGNDEIITGPGAGGGPHVRVFEQNGTPVGGFMAYAPAFSGGVDVAGGDVTGTSADEVVTGAGPGAGPHVRIFNGQGVAQGGFAAYTNFAGGVRLSVGNVRTSSAKSEILTAPAKQGGSHIRMFQANGTVLSEKVYLEPWWIGYYDIAAGTGDSYAATGLNRRASIRDGL